MSEQRVCDILERVVGGERGEISSKMLWEILGDCRSDAHKKAFLFLVLKSLGLLMAEGTEFSLEDPVPAHAVQEFLLQVRNSRSASMPRNFYA